MIVKQPKRGRPKGAGNKLHTENILAIAKCLMKEDKKIPSIRKLALALHVDPMAIYHYFKNKDALLEAITTSLIDDIYQPQANSFWQQELSELCMSYLTLLSNYPGLLDTLLSMQSHTPAEVFSERFTVIIKPLKLDAESTENALHLLADYLHGYALALSHQTKSISLNVSMLSGPLKLYCIALENS